VIDFLGFDRLWFGILFLVSAQMAYISPPFGYTLFYMKGVLPDGIGMATVYRAIVPFLFLQALGIAICALFPEFVLWLPRTMVQ
jgi:TRAP-type mannitol/chloroaromatic compound transport system permease large subunit